MTEPGRLTSADIEGRDVIVILPLGSWEQHGPHLPLDTDSIIIDAVVTRTVQSHPHGDLFVVAPTMPITASDEHAGFAGGLSTGTAALADAVVAVGRSASAWAAGVVIANGHGGNADALHAIASALGHESVRHSVWSLPAYRGGDMHAGRTETSLMLHLDASHVRLDRIPPGSDTEISVDDLRAKGVRATSSSGVLGRPSLASAEHGEQVMTAYLESFTNHLTERAVEWLNVRR